MMQTTVPPPFPLNDPRDDSHAPRTPEALQALYDRSVDSVKGYEKMVEKAEPSFRGIARRFLALHKGHAEEVARMLAEQGADIEGDGSIMGTINQAVVTFRAFFDEIDEDVMDQIRNGEDWVLKSFDKAIDEQSGSVAARLTEMQTELTHLLADTRHLG